MWRSDIYHLILQALVDDFNLSCLHSVRRSITTKENTDTALYLLYVPSVPLAEAFIDD